jgi:hypothetical protein
MAENKIPDLPPTPPTRHDYHDAKGKVVESIEIVTDAEYYGITVRFEDKTSLTFAMETCVFAFPIYEDWTSGEAKPLKQFRPVRSEISSD